MGAAGRALRSTARRRRRPRCANFTKNSALALGEARRARPARRLSDALRLSDHAGRGVGRAPAPRSSPNPDEVASVHRIALDDIEREDAFSFTTIPESTRRVIRFRHAGQHHPRADGGADLPVPRSAGRAATPASPSWNSRCLRGSGSAHCERSEQCSPRMLAALAMTGEACPEAGLRIRIVSATMPPTTRTVRGARSNVASGTSTLAVAAAVLGLSAQSFSPRAKLSRAAPSRW